MWNEHVDPNVRQALIRLCDALCSWERSTGRQNLLVLIEHDDVQPFSRYEFIADCGKPIPDDARHGMPPEEFVKAHSEMYARGGP